MEIIERILPSCEEKATILNLVRQTREAVQRMTRITSDLLEVTKIESGQFPIHRLDVPIHGLIQGVFELYQPMATKKGITIGLEIPPEEITAYCDRDRIFQVLGNLLDNSIKFTPENGKIGISVLCAGEWVQIRVKDSGPGIPVEQQQKVFERFWQAKHTQYLGSGLGLYIAKNILTAHGGRIWLESTPGKGSTFGFELPQKAQAGNK